MTTQTLSMQEIPQESYTTLDTEAEEKLQEGAISALSELCRKVVASPLLAMEWLTEKPDAFPRIAVQETDSEIRFISELPGISRSQIALEYANGMLVINVTVIHPYTTMPGHHTRVHRRAVSMPVYTNGNALKAVFAEETLTITLPKSDTPVPPSSPTIPVSEQEAS